MEPIKPVYLTPATIDICDDCVVWIEYGDEAEGVPADHAEHIMDTWGGVLMTSSCGIECCGEEPQSWFSWGPCDGCGSRLGGNRSHATVWEDLS